MAIQPAIATNPEGLTRAFEYLDALRESGVVNMWGAQSYIERDLRLGSEDARFAHGQWMTTFSDEPASVRAAQVSA